MWRVPHATTDYIGFSWFIDSDEDALSECLHRLMGREYIELKVAAMCACKCAPPYLYSSPGVPSMPAARPLHRLLWRRYLPLSGVAQGARVTYPWRWWCYAILIEEYCIEVGGGNYREYASYVELRPP